MRSLSSIQQFLKNIPAVGLLAFAVACSSGGRGGGAVFFQDADGDGFGNAELTKKFTSTALLVIDSDGVQYVTNDTDCNDTNASANPGASETVDSVDNDCDGAIDEEADGSLTQGDPDTDDDLDGYTESQGDCDDSESDVNPSAQELCGNNGDDDCDGKVDADDDSASADTYYADADGDGLGDANTSQTVCTLPSGYVENSSDCDDTSASVTQYSYYVDADGDGYGAEDTDEISSCSSSAPAGYASNDNDCNDSSASESPADKEGYFYGNHSDGKDNDCDGTTDEEGCNCDDLTGYQTKTSAFNFKNWLINDAVAADGPDIERSGIMDFKVVDRMNNGPTKLMASCDSRLSEFQSTEVFQDKCEEKTTTTTTTDTDTDTAYLEKLKFWVKILDNDWAHITNDGNWAAIRLGIDFKSGADFKCTFDTMDMALPGGFGTKGGDDDFTVDLKSMESKGCFTSSVNWDDIQIDNIEKIYFEATESVTEWGISQIHITGIHSDTSELKFYINEGVWAYVGNKSSASSHYPKESSDCFKDGAYDGFAGFNTIGQVDVDAVNSDYLNAKFPKSTIAFTPSDWWTLVKISSPDESWSGTLNHFFMSFDCSDWLEMRDLDRNKTRYTRFYTPNQGGDGADFSSVSMGINGSDELKLDYLKIEAYQAWSTTGTRKTYKVLKNGSGAIYTFSDSSDKHSVTLTSGRETFN